MSLISLLSRLFGLRSLITFSSYQNSTITVVLTGLAIPLGAVIGFGLCALMSRIYDSELYRFPLVISQTSYGFAFIFLAIAAIISGLIVHRQLVHLDLIGVLKTRE